MTVKTSILKGAMKVSAIVFAVCVLSLESGATDFSLAEQFRPYVRTLKHAVYVYNYIPRAWTSIGANSSLNQIDPTVTAHLSSMVRSYWNPNSKVGSDAPGLYTSDDPFSSRRIGNKANDGDWLLFRIELPAGHRYLDLRAMDADTAHREISDEMRKTLADEGCPSQDYYKYIVRKSDVGNCRKIAFNTLIELKVDSFFYDWSWIYFKNCPTQSKAAMVLLNPAIIQNAKIQGFSSRIPESDTVHSERVVLQSLIQDIARDESTPNKLPTAATMTPFWPNLKLDEIPNIKTWERKHLLGCDGS